MTTDSTITPKLKIGTRRCQCAGCGRFFGGARPFDDHQRLTGGRYDRLVVCLDPATIGMVERDGFWGTEMPLEARGRAQNSTKGGGVG